MICLHSRIGICCVGKRPISGRAIRLGHRSSVPAGTIFGLDG